MKKKVFTVIPLFALILSLMAGCSASREAPGLQKEGADANVAYDGEVSGADDRSGSFTPEIDAGAPQTSGKKIIYTALISVEVNDVKEAMDEITAKVTEFDGYISGSDYYNKDRVAGTVTARIPPGKLSELTEKIGGLGKVLSTKLSSDDVTFQYVDIESRLKSAEAQEKQLLELMEKATEIEGILAVRYELARVQEEIEVYKGQLRYYDNMVDFSTVTIQLTETYVPKSPEADENEGLLARWGFDYIGSNIAKGFKNSITFVTNAFGFILIVLSYALIPLLIIGAFIFAIVFVTRKISKRKAKKSVPAVAGPKDPNKKA
ncbi:MAG: DUF4349 domain-containing protein [Clostridiaceae bacterium]|mgnify:CR=1 FL=1|nr:DUF4349 domain-containing protein [Clostridiaceae bacterium]